MLCCRPLLGDADDSALVCVCVCLCLFVADAKCSARAVAKLLHTGQQSPIMYGVHGVLFMLPSAFVSFSSRPLLCAVGEKQVEALQMLSDASISSAVVADERGSTPRDVAEKEGATAAKDLLAKVEATELLCVEVALEWEGQGRL